MELARGEIWWAELPEPTGLDPGYRRPVLIVQNDAFNRSRLHTTIAVVLTGNLRLVDAPGNVLLPARATAVKELEAMPLKARRKLVTEIRGLSAEPRPPGSEKLSGQERYRIRQGDYRAIYSIDDREQSVLVVKIGHRGDVYRK